MSREALIVLVVAAVVLVAGAAGLMVAVPGTTSISQEGPADGFDPPARDGSRGVVVGLYEKRAGLTILGMRLRSPEYAGQVMLTPPDGCLATDDSGQQTVIDTGECAGVAAGGPVAGDGVSADGQRVVTVEVSLGRACYRALEVGAVWPSETCPEAARK